LFDSRKFICREYRFVGLGGVDNVLDML